MDVGWIRVKVKVNVKVKVKVSDCSTIVFMILFYLQARASVTRILNNLLTYLLTYVEQQTDWMIDSVQWSLYSSILRGKLHLTV